MMRSPSSLRLNLTVPWDAGWEGPICSSITSSVGSEVKTSFAQRAGKAIFRNYSLATTICLVPSASARGRARGLDRIDFGHQRLAPVIRIVLAQRIALEGVIKQDPAQVGMAAEFDAEHVEAFALQPIRRFPFAIQTVGPGVLARHRHLVPQAMVQGQGFELRDDFEARRAANPVHRR